MSGEATLLRAALFAVRAQAGQVRKGRAGTPYIDQPLEVAHFAAEAGATGPVLVGALPHDLGEDSGTTLGQIADAFGVAAAEIVGALTDAPECTSLPRPQRKAQQAVHIANAPESARLVKIADQTSNLFGIARDPAAWGLAAGRDYVAGTKLVVDAARGVSTELEARYDAAAERALAALEQEATR